jgi:hypothetical protein
MNHLRPFNISENINKYDIPYEFTQTELLSISKIDTSDIIDHIEISGHHPLDVSKATILVNSINNGVRLFVDGELSNDCFLRHILIFNRKD